MVLGLIWFNLVFPCTLLSPIQSGLHQKDDLRKKKLDSVETQWDSTFSMELCPRDSVKFYSNGNT